MLVFKILSRSAKIGFSQESGVENKGQIERAGWGTTHLGKCTSIIRFTHLCFVVNCYGAFKQMMVFLYSFKEKTFNAMYHFLITN